MNGVHSPNQVVNMNNYLSNPQESYLQGPGPELEESHYLPLGSNLQEFGFIIGKRPQTQH